MIKKKDYNKKKKSMLWNVAKKVLFISFVFMPLFKKMVFGYFFFFPFLLAI